MCAINVAPSVTRPASAAGICATAFTRRLVASTAAPAEAPGALPGLTRGELLCQAFEAYRLLLPTAQISFEHTVFLATALARGDQLRFGRCSDCGGLLVTERFPLRSRRCHHCASPMQSRC